MKCPSLFFILFLFIARALLGKDILDRETMQTNILLNSKILQSEEIEGFMRQKETLQSSLKPNPELTVIGEIDSRSCNQSNISIGISQVIETAGKRNARILYAETIEAVQAWEQVITRNQLLAEALHKLIDTAALQENLALAKELQDIANQAKACHQTLYDNGKILSLAQRKAAMQCSLRKVNQVKAKNLWETAKQSLALLWGETQACFDKVFYPLEDLPPLPIWELLLECLKSNPEIAKKEAEIYSTYKLCQLEKKQGIPNVLVSGAVTNYYRNRDQCIDFGLSVPLPVNNRNQHNVAKAHLARINVELQLHDLNNQLKVKLRSFYDQCLTAWQEIQLIKEHILAPTAETLADIEEGYRRGKFSLEELLEAKKEFLEVKATYTEALKNYHHHYIDVLNLIDRLEI